MCKRVCSSLFSDVEVIIGLPQNRWLKQSERWSEKCLLLPNRDEQDRLLPDVEDCVEAGHTTSQRARYAVVAYGKAGSDDGRQLRGSFDCRALLYCGRTASAARMGTAQSTVRSFTSAKERSVACSEGWVEWIRTGLN